jgi:hypothetical protein
MQPPARNTRSKASPGLVDLPGPRRSSAVVAQEKAIRQQAAALKAEESRRRAQQVSEVEGEIKRAQAEANAVRQGGWGKRDQENLPAPRWGRERKFLAPFHPPFTDFFPTDPYNKD